MYNYYNFLSMIQEDSVAYDKDEYVLVRVQIPQEYTTTKVRQVCGLGDQLLEFLEVRHKGGNY